MTSRYARAGRVYDVVSLEAVLYRRPRARLFEMLGPLPGATIVDVGCGTGLNLPALRRAVGPGGTIVGIDASPDMLAAAGRRIRRAGWSNVMLIEGNGLDLDTTLRAAPLDRDAIGGLVATFVLSLLADDTPFWDTVDELASQHPRRVALADLGPPDGAPPIVRPLLSALTAVGGGDPDRRPWERLAADAGDAVHERFLGGHVHLAVGTWDADASGRPEGPDADAGAGRC